MSLEEKTPPKRIKRKRKSPSLAVVTALNTIREGLESRAILPMSRFEGEGEKTAGVSAGRLVSDNSGKVSLLKIAENAPSSEIINPEINRSQESDKRDLVRETLFGKFYNRVLPGQSPITNVVVEDKSALNPVVIDPNKKAAGWIKDAKTNEWVRKTWIQDAKTNEWVRNAPIENTSTPKDSPKQVFMRTKFFENFETLAQFSEADSLKSGEINEHSPKLHKMEGFEKVIAACIFGGERDYHGGNLGVVTKDGISTVVKIDHGLSGGFKENDINSVLARAQYNMVSFGYSQISCDIVKVKDALDQMTKITDDEIKNIFARGMHDLKRAGMTDQAIKELPNFAEKMIESRELMKGVSERLSVISLIDPKRNDWLIEIGPEDPVKYAIKALNRTHKPVIYKIEGHDPLVWAILNDKKIDGKDPLEYCKDPTNKTNLLHHIMRDYPISERHPNYEEKNKKLEQVYDKFRGKSAMAAPSLDALLRDDPKNIAQSISRQPKGQKDEISIQSLTENCSLQQLHKLSEVGSFIKDVEGDNIKSRFKRGLYKLKRGIKNIVTKDVPNEQMKNALQELKIMGAIPKERTLSQDSHLSASERKNVSNIRESLIHPTKTTPTFQSEHAPLGHLVKTVGAIKR